MRWPVSSAARGVEGAGENDDELVASQPGHEIGRSDRSPDPPRDVLQHAVPGIVTVGVVERLDVVEVDELHGPGHASFDWLMNRRDTAEAANSWLKRTLPKDRARGVGRDRQHADFVFAAVYRNLYVELAQAERRHPPKAVAA